MKKPSFAKYVERHDRIKNSQDIDLNEWWPFGGGKKQAAPAPAPQDQRSKAARDYATASAVNGLNNDAPASKGADLLRRDGIRGAFDDLETGFGFFLKSTWGKHPSLQAPFNVMHDAYKKFLAAVKVEQQAMKSRPKPDMSNALDDMSTEFKGAQAHKGLNLARDPKNMTPPGTDRIGGPLGR